MTRVEVQGRDVAMGAYRIKTDAGRAFVPETMMPRGPLPGNRPTHQMAYEWIAAHRSKLARAVEALQNGKTPRPPYDLLTLIEAD